MSANVLRVPGVRPVTIVACVAVALLCMGLIACADDGQPIPDGSDERPLTYAAPAWSARGVIAYGDRGFRDIAGAWAYVDSLAGIWTYDTATHDRRRVLPLANYPSWSPEGVRLSYWRNYSIGVFDTDTRVERQLIAGGDYNNPAKWAPCSGSLIHVSTRGAPYDYSIWTIDPETGDRQNVTPGEGGLRDPVWYSGCDSVLHKRFVTVNGSPADSVYVMSSQTLVPHSIFDSGYEEHALGMSPDGRYVSYTVDGIDGRDRIYIYDRRSHSLVGKSGSLGRDVAWEPDGTRYVYVGRIPAGRDGVNSVLLIVDQVTNESTPIHAEWK